MHYRIIKLSWSWCTLLHNKFSSILKCWYQRAQLDFLIGSWSKSVLKISHFSQQLNSHMNGKVNSVNVSMNFRQNVLQCKPFCILQVHDIIISCGEIIIHHPVNNIFNVSSQRMTHTSVHIVFIDLLKRHVTTLQDVQHFPHVAIRQSYQGLPSIISDIAAEKLRRIN